MGRWGEREVGRWGGGEVERWGEREGGIEVGACLAGSDGPQPEAQQPQMWPHQPIHDDTNLHSLVFCKIYTRGAAVELGTSSVPVQGQTSPSRCHQLANLVSTYQLNCYVFIVVQILS